MLIALAAAIGASSLVLYPLSSSHAQDLAGRENAVEVSSGLLLAYTIGAIVGPTTAAWLMGWIGPQALFMHNGAIHVAVRALHRVAAVATPAAPGGQGLSDVLDAAKFWRRTRRSRRATATRSPRPCSRRTATPRGAVLINSATAVPRKIYRGFATYLAQQGFTVLTYDYRGTGGSRPRSLRGFTVRMRDWAALDVAAAIDHMRTVWPKLPLAVVGHSFGGQAVGLAPNNGEISRALLVAAQAGYWRLFHSPEKYRVYPMLRLIGTPIARLIGYMPGRLGIGEDLPRDVFLEWTGWVMKPRYFFDDATLDALENFPRYRGALRAICLTDDPWATAPAVDLLCSGFTGTRPSASTSSARGRRREDRPFRLLPPGASRHALARRGGVVTTVLILRGL